MWVRFPLPVFIKSGKYMFWIFYIITTIITFIGIGILIQEDKKQQTYMTLQDLVILCCICLIGFIPIVNIITSLIVLIYLMRKLNWDKPVYYYKNKNKNKTNKDTYKV